MLTVLHPEALIIVHKLSTGLLTLKFKDDDHPKLIIKASKELILTAKLNQGFKIYVIPVQIHNKYTMGLITAFFDDEDEPLCISTPMFDDQYMQDFRAALLSSKLDVHFFDENNRELLGYTADLKFTPETQDYLAKTELLPFDTYSARSMLEQMRLWFGLRNPQDDISAISVIFESALFAEDLFITDLIPDKHLYIGNQGYSNTELVRNEPGKYQEQDILQLLQRVFSPQQIYHNPLRVTDREEIADIVVVTNSRILFIQAKDNPNTEQISQHSIIRKKTTSLKKVTEAVGQVRGAVRYARSMSPMKMLVDGKEYELKLDKYELHGLVVVKELFNDKYSEYSSIILAMAKDIQVPCIALDYMELHMFAFNLLNEESFFQAYYTVFRKGSEDGIFPRLRFGFSDSE